MIKKEIQIQPTQVAATATPSITGESVEKQIALLAERLVGARESVVRLAQKISGQCIVDDPMSDEPPCQGFLPRINNQISEMMSEVICISDLLNGLHAAISGNEEKADKARVA